MSDPVFEQFRYVHGTYGPALIALRNMAQAGDQEAVALVERAGAMAMGLLREVVDGESDGVVAGVELFDMLDEIREFVASRA